MDVVVKGRNSTISDSFRAHVEDKVSKVEQLAPRAIRVEVVLTHNPNVRQPETAERIEITVIAKGPVLRAEATASDKYAALDLSWAKLMERLRRARDRQKISRQGKHRQASTAEVLGDLEVIDPIEEQVAEEKTAIPNTDHTNGRVPAEGDSPVVLREKTFPAEPIELEDALNRMEMVGHDFYLYQDATTGKASVVYRRKGWSYGVIALDPNAPDQAADSAAADEAAN